jgi:hypothetical protein
MLGVSLGGLVVALDMLWVCWGSAVDVCVLACCCER